MSYSRCENCGGDPRTCDCRIAPHAATQPSAEGSAQTPASERDPIADRDGLNWRTCGVIELAVRNPNVSSYMDHWEGRATKAEQEIASLRTALAAATARAETAEAYLRDVSVILSDAGVLALTVRSGVIELRERAEKSEAERDAALASVEAAAQDVGNAYLQGIKQGHKERDAREQQARTALEDAQAAAKRTTTRLGDIHLMARRILARPEKAPKYLGYIVQWCEELGVPPASLFRDDAQQPPRSDAADAQEPPA